MICLAVLVPAIVSTVMLKSVANGIHVMDAFASGPAFVQVLGPAAALGCFMLGMIAHIGITGSWAPGRRARVVWPFGGKGGPACHVADDCYSSCIDLWSVADTVASEIVLGDWAGLGVLLSWGADNGGWRHRRARPVNRTRTAGSPSSRRSKLRNLVATIAPYVFIVGFVLGVANCVHLITTPHILIRRGRVREDPDPDERRSGRDRTTPAGEFKHRFVDVELS